MQLQAATARRAAGGGLCVPTGGLRKSVWREHMANNPDRNSSNPDPKGQTLRVEHKVFSHEASDLIGSAGTPLQHRGDAERLQPTRDQRVWYTSNPQSTRQTMESLESNRDQKSKIHAAAPHSPSHGCYSASPFHGVTPDKLCGTLQTREQVDASTLRPPDILYSHQAIERHDLLLPLEGQQLPRRRVCVQAAPNASDDGECGDGDYRENTQKNKHYNRSCTTQKDATESDPPGFQLFERLKGQPFKAEFCGPHLCINDQPTFFIAAAHATAPFTFDFSGRLDVRSLIHLAGSLGLFVVLEGMLPCDLSEGGPWEDTRGGGAPLEDVAALRAASSQCLRQQVPPWISHSLTAPWGTLEAEFQLLLHAQADARSCHLRPSRELHPAFAATRSHPDAAAAAASP
ncbi:hypothetical protein cyc_03873 [Cyclospora cayetanensis]|uniref:Uncharacterized protein n=1 Tax=Cyclospora cayetanensis TaxID=88456 RepID=A0A1D3D7U3_9EIME|nr:hypothetical protein cyc_03873 [Cyclospora cayetanensis]